jgi:hypothetical protein
MESKEMILANIKLVRDQAQIVLKMTNREKQAKHLARLAFWLNFLETRYEFMVFSECIK